MGMGQLTVFIWVILKASDDLLRGPLTEETKGSDETDGEIMMEDPERLEPRSDEEDTYVSVILRTLF